MSEQNHWVNGEMFLVVPYGFRELIASSRGGAAIMGDWQSIKVDGRWPRVICGFNVYETNALPKARVNNQNCLYLIAGPGDAYAYAASPVKVRVVEDEYSNLTKILIVIAWGGAMRQADWITVAFGNFVPQFTQ
ncbi:MAG: hypothetical protein LBV23_10920 [Deltaproteobacteria bacterium]|nr:hypothetical protein [Deltaproteobacteria bacterium]